MFDADSWVEPVLTWRAALQAADVITFHRTSGPELPIFLAEATGIWPTSPSLMAQSVLVSIYLLGAAYVFVLKPRMGRRVTQSELHTPSLQAPSPQAPSPQARANASV